MPRLPLQDVDLYYEVHGSGPDVIFVHGSGGNHLSWWRQLATLSKRYRCIILDLRGYGLSRTSAPTGDLTVLCGDLHALLDHLGVARGHLVGQSVGGHVCLRFALLYPQRTRSLVLASTLAGISNSRIAEAIAAAGPVPEGLMERALSPGFKSGNPDLVVLYQAIERLNHSDGEPRMPGPANVEARELESLRMPTLFLAGDADPVAPPAAMAAGAGSITGAQFQVVADSGHSIYCEKPDAFNRALTSFFDAVG